VGERGPSTKVKNLGALCEYLGITDLVVEVLQSRQHQHQPWKGTAMANGPTCVVCGHPIDGGEGDHAE
jgi:hypothetical protein